MIGLNSQLFGVCSTTQTDKGCTVCSVDGDCMVCNEDDHYAYDSLTSQCAAAVGYYLNLTDFPELCSSAIIGCL